MAQRAIAKTEALKATITHRPKTSSPLKASMTVEPPPLPPRAASPALHMNVNRFAVEAGY
ncbi:hypothetical protein LTR78_003782 [Recurvomyces mirabilis]|uniref:Uncharacterized protein n=1 Tax=Recurvomyces mirabilis TaxID=574656 RepID=A0AAE0WR71_9PEZI|nr:hypothetical protein LTR78_003782 [Recurvomyces mirabilis]KAK5154894.1 hypothetical protein LTS14_006475 [Recurvomyces mirabilis]